MLKAGVPLGDALESMLSKTINPLLNKTIEKSLKIFQLDRHYQGHWKNTQKSLIQCT